MQPQERGGSGRGCGSFLSLRHSVALSMQAEGGREGGRQERRDGGRGMLAVPAGRDIPAAEGVGGEARGAARGLLPPVPTAAAGQMRSQLKATPRTPSPATPIWR